MRGGRSVPPSIVYRKPTRSAAQLFRADGGRGEAGHPAQDPRCAPRHHPPRRGRRVPMAMDLGFEGVFKDT